MKILISVLSIVLLMLSACATTDAKSSSSSVTTAQSKALSKINNVKGNHSSVNGAGLNGQSITTMATDCYKHEFTMNFDGNYTPPQKINCEEDIDFSSFENDSLKLFRSTALGASKRSDTGKQMVFYMGDEYSAFMVDAKFYKDDYYSGPGISDNGSFFYNYMKNDQSEFYFIMYTWDDEDGVSIDISEGITSPKISKKLTSISFGNKDDVCSMSPQTKSFCKIYVNAYNEDDQKYDQYTASFESLMSQGRNLQIKKV